MDAREGNNVKRRKKNKPCGFDLGGGRTCTKSQQYAFEGNIHKYCKIHFNEWIGNNASARAVPAEITLVVATNTTTTVDESNNDIHHDDNGEAASAGDVILRRGENDLVHPQPSAESTGAASAEDVPAESTSAVEPNTTTTADESSAPNIVALERDVPAGSTSTVEPNTTTTADESSAANIAASERVRVGTSAVESNTTTTVHVSNISNHHAENEVVHPEPSINDDGFNTGNDFFVAQDDGHDLDIDDTAQLPATIEISDTAIVTNSRQ